MHIRDRIKELRRVKASELQPHPQNWRRHPAAQQDALRGLLAEIGYAGALLARELPDGSLQLIDGHLRAETTPEMEVPVLVVDLDDDEAAKLLALYDPLAAMAEANQEVQAELAAKVETRSEALRSLLNEIIAEPPPLENHDADDQPAAGINLDESYQIVITCADEAQQHELYDRMTAEGLKSKLLTL